MQDRNRPGGQTKYRFKQEVYVSRSTERSGSRMAAHPCGHGASALCLSALPPSAPWSQGGGLGHRATCLRWEGWGVRSSPFKDLFLSGKEIFSSNFLDRLASGEKTGSVFRARPTPSREGKGRSVWGWGPPPPHGAYSAPSRHLLAWGRGGHRTEPRAHSGTSTGGSQRAARGGWSGAREGWGALGHGGEP